MKVNSSFKLNINTDLSDKDFKVLTLLYQPLIGMKALSLYNTFYYLSNFNKTYLHQTIFDLLNINNVEFIKEREKLEALGLLETYEKNQTNYVYVIKTPYSAKRFLKDTFLGTYLESEIGSENIKKLISLFEVNNENIDDFENITKTFDDLYKIRSRRLLTIEQDIEGRNGSNNNLIRNKIDYNLLIDKLPRSVKHPILFNDNFKQQIMQLAFVYQFNIDDLVNIFIDANKGRDDLSIEEINLKAKMYFEKNNEEIMVLDKQTDDVSLMDSLPFKTVVNKFASKDKLIKADALATINEFITQNDIEVGVLNVLIIFLLKNKDGRLPHVNYLNKVWDSWYKNGVRTTKDAIKHREYIESNWTSGTKQTRQIKKPDWLDEYINELEEMEG